MQTTVLLSFLNFTLYFIYIYLLDYTNRCFIAPVKKTKKKIQFKIIFLKFLKS
jgi:uncharacterized membrane protein (DUF485 family)